jgi:hypothetical protein
MSEVGRNDRAPPLFPPRALGGALDCASHSAEDAAVSLELPGYQPGAQRGLLK